MRKRETNFDLLRIASTIAVIFIHVGSYFVAASFAYNLDDYGFVFAGNIFMSFVFDTLPRFAVPCFVMLSGAFILEDKRNADFGYFYGKTFRSIGIPTIIFSLFYTLYNLLKSIGKVLIRCENPIVLFEPLKRLLIGKPFYHMWYLYMLLILYLLTPFIFILQKELKNKEKMPGGGYIFAFLCLASISYWTGTYTMGWDIGNAFCYLSYYLIGYKIRAWSKGRKSSVKGYCLILIGFFGLAFLAFMRYKLASSGVVIQKAGNVIVKDERLEVFAYEGLDPFVVIASVFIFAGFSLLDIKSNSIISHVSSVTFYIYLFHGGILDVIKKLLQVKTSLIVQNNFAIPFYVVLVLAASIVCTIIYCKLWKTLEQHWDITERLCKLFKT